MKPLSKTTTTSSTPLSKQIQKSKSPCKIRTNSSFAPSNGKTPPRASAVTGKTSTTHSLSKRLSSLPVKPSQPPSKTTVASSSIPGRTIPLNVKTGTSGSKSGVTASSTRASASFSSQSSLTDARLSTSLGRASIERPNSSSRTSASSTATNTATDFHPPTQATTSIRTGTRFSSTSSGYTSVLPSASRGSRAVLPMSRSSSNVEQTTTKSVTSPAVTSPTQRHMVTRMSSLSCAPASSKTSPFSSVKSSIDDSSLPEEAGTTKISELATSRMPPIITRATTIEKQSNKFGVKMSVSKEKNLASNKNDNPKQETPSSPPKFSSVVSLSESSATTPTAVHSLMKSSSFGRFSRANPTERKLTGNTRIPMHAGSGLSSDSLFSRRLSSESPLQSGVTLSSMRPPLRRKSSDVEKSKRALECSEELSTTPVENQNIDMSEQQSETDVSVCPVSPSNVSMGVSTITMASNLISNTLDSEQIRLSQFSSDTGVRASSPSTPKEQPIQIASHFRTSDRPVINRNENVVEVEIVSPQHDSNFVPSDTSLERTPRIKAPSSVDVLSPVTAPSAVQSRHSSTCTPENLSSRNPSSNTLGEKSTIYSPLAESQLGSLRNTYEDSFKSQTSRSRFCVNRPSKLLSNVSKRYQKSTGIDVNLHTSRSKKDSYNQCEPQHLMDGILRRPQVKPVASKSITIFEKEISEKPKTPQMRIVAALPPPSLCIDNTEQLTSSSNLFTTTLPSSTGNSKTYSAKAIAELVASSLTTPVTAQIDPDAVVCATAILLGSYSIKIGKGTIIQPGAYINAEKGPIEIGEDNIIEELVVVENRASEPLVIGNSNFIETGCCILDASSIGNGNQIEPKCFVGPKSTIMNGCLLSSGSCVPHNMVIPDATIVYGKIGELTQNHEDDNIDAIIKKQQVFVSLLSSKLVPILQSTQSRRRGNGLPDVPPIVETTRT